jgi:hypothetical protein
MKESGKYSDPIRIRVHLLLCIQRFHGYGYTTEFVSHMARVISFLKSDQYYKLQIAVKADELCSRCSYNVDGRCIKEFTDKINKVDKLLKKQI